MYTYETKGVCAKKINFDISNSKIISVSFIGGCQGNAVGLSRLIQGMEITEAIRRLKGIACGSKDTSCPDQLSKALEEVSASLT